MGRHRQRPRRRLALLAPALLALVCSAAPVMADQAEPPAKPSEYSLPDPAEIGAAYAAQERAEEERREDLQQPAFVAQRESSRHAFADDTPAEAEELLRATFGKTFAELNQEPARFLSDAKLDQNLGHGSAIVTAEGETEILEAGQPIETENPEGETKKVDVSLEEGPEGFKAGNPLVETVIGATAEEGVEIGEEGLTVTQVGAGGSKGRLFGDRNVYFGEIEEGSDTDLIVSPTARGVELFDMLRSVDSPETLRFRLKLPEGDTLKLLEQNGVEILDPEGSIVGFVSRPSAEDAQGTAVPVELGLEGDTVVLHTSHREEDLAYPILVDPIVEGENQVEQAWNGWWQGQGLQGLGSWWEPAANSAAAAHFTKGQVTGGQWAGMSGLFESIQNGPIGEGTAGEWVLNSPNMGTKITNVGGYPFWRYDGGSPVCQASQEPYDFEGLYDDSPGQNRWIALQFNQATAQYQNISLQGWGHQLIFGLMANVNFEAQCWRDLMLGGVHFTLGDWAAPVMVSATSSAPGGWVNGSAPFSIHVVATDGGTGVKEFGFAPDAEHNPGNPVPKAVGCAGNYESLCPSKYDGSFSFTAAEFPQGEDNLSVTARSPTEKRSNSSPVTIKVDTEPPVLHLDGQLMAAVQKGEGQTGEKQGEGGPELTQSVYSLKVEALDGVEGTANVQQMRSGVKTVEVSVTDATGSKIESTEAFPNPKAPCTQGSCAESLAYPIPMTGLTAGRHQVIVKAWDFAGNAAAEVHREFEYFPATGLTEEDITQRFLLPDGVEHGEGSYQGPELAVNVMNGNVVYRQRDVEVEGPTANLEVELFYNSQLPREQSSEFGRGWTLSQTPSLKPSGSMATALTSESQLTGNVALPQEVGKEKFSDKLDAVITKEPGGGYSVSEEGGAEASATVYDASGQTTEVQTSPTASIDYTYDSGKLAEIAVDDPGATDLSPPPAKPAPSIVPIYVSSFGSGGSGNGQFGHPADIALDPKGDLWVADENNNRIQEFTQGGEFVKAFGSSGSGNGQFNRPKSIAFTADGSHLWVADSGNNRLQEFKANGEFVKAVGTFGSGNGQFNGPESIAIDPQGNIWVSDTYNLRIEELNPAGEFIKVVNPSGMGAIEPGGIDVGPEGRVWVADWIHNRLVELSTSAELIRVVGSEGTGNGKFQRPDEIAVGSHGEVWVGDEQNSRVQEFDAEGQYVTQFGSAGSGAGQFAFSYPLGIATDDEGSLFVTDTDNNRVEHWQVPHFGNRPVYAASFGTTGTGQGQYRHPGDLAVDGQNHVWVPDTENNRIQELNQQGEVIGVLGSAGTGNGQFQSPKSIAFAPDGEFWVTDSANGRLEEFSRGGQFIRAVGSDGAGNGQFHCPEAVAVAPDGHVWVADTENHRIVELDEEGNFIKVVNPSGMGAIEPTGIAFGPGGNAWIADWAGNRVVEISPAGELVRQVGSAGAGNGQFNRPDTVAVDGRGLLYVVDQNNGRVQVFDQAGEYLSQFGSAGKGTAQFTFGYPTGIAADNRGNLWIADSENDRIQRWQTGSWVPVEEEAIPTGDDPSVEVSTSAGLVTSVAGVEAGSRHYGHSGELLTSDEGPQGTTHYEYEPTQMLKKVTLPNGTTAAIEYDSVGRATEVTIDPAGTPGPQWTKFEYVQEIPKAVAEGHAVPLGSREVIVEPEAGARTFYAIDAAGDVLESWNVEVAPSIFSETGTLTQQSKEKAIDPNDTQELQIKAFAPEGIRAIQIVVNGSTIVAEKTCTGTAAQCEYETIQWIVEPEDLPAGTMWIEAVLTSRVEEHGEPRRSSTRWWVTVPYVPPPEAGAPQPPKYKRVLEFREEYGLDLDLNPVADELQLHRRVWETIDAWWEPETPAGQVANATWERWGMPLRYVDEQELEYRLAYIAQDARLIQEWAKAHAWNLYGGNWVDQRAGGLIRVGFTEHQSELVAQMKQELGSQLMAPERITTFTTPPTWTIAQSEASAETLGQYRTSHPTMEANVSGVEFNTVTNKVRVGAENVAAAEAEVPSVLGSLAHVEVVFEPFPDAFSGRYRKAGPIKAGDYMAQLIGNRPFGCTAGYGLTEHVPGAWAPRRFLLTAGHCYQVGVILKRQESLSTPAEFWRPIGEVVRNALPLTQSEGETDALVAALDSGDFAPTEIFPARPVRPGASSSEWQRPEELCFSGVVTEEETGYKVRCGPVLDADYKTRLKFEDGGLTGKMLFIRALLHARKGDSGSPVWNKATGRAVGIISGGNESTGRTTITPLKSLASQEGVEQPGILRALSHQAGPLELVIH